MKKTSVDLPARLRRLSVEISNLFQETPKSSELIPMFVEMETGLEQVMAQAGELRDRVFFILPFAKQKGNAESSFVESLFEKHLPNVAGEALLVNCRLIEDILPCFEAWLEYCFEQNDFERALKVCSYIQESTPSSPLLNRTLKRIGGNL